MSKALPVYDIQDLKKIQPKNQESLNLIAELMQRFLDHIFAYYDSPLPIGSDEIIKRLQMWIIHNVDIKKGKNSQFLGEITIKPYI